MLIKVITHVILEVDDEEQAEEACNKLDMGLDGALSGFPVGELVSAEVDTYKKVTDEEAEEKGWVE